MQRNISDRQSRYTDRISISAASAQDHEHDACGVGFIYSPQQSHQLIEQALTALSNLEHRGALGADGQSGDGAGILTSIPWALLKGEGWQTDQIRAVGVVFLPRQDTDSCRQVATDFFIQQGFSVAGWRQVPVNHEVLGPDAARACPRIEFVLLGAEAALDDQALEEKLLLARKLLILKIFGLFDSSGFYIASLSATTVVYKAMVKSQTLPQFYSDLQNELFESKWAVFHRRFSTNTNPNWKLAQPFRMLAHNGEINTLSGNRNWLHAREMVMDHPLFTDRRDTLRPLVHPLGSDSANLDNLFELFVQAGLSPQEAMMRLMPEAHSQDCHLKNPDLASFYEYHAALQEPWDGPALIVYSDGRYLGAVLDRNGLRPARYTVLRDGTVLLCSEAGVLDLNASEVIEKGRLGPGQMIALDIATGTLRRNDEIKDEISSSYPYADWLATERKELSGKPDFSAPRLSRSELLALQCAAGYGQEDVEQVIAVMSDTGSEPVFSMGDDTTLPILSRQARVLFDYFRQRFAQVTNPPIDHLRERLVFSLNSYLGQKSTALRPGPKAAGVLKLETPFLTEAELEEASQLLAPARLVSLLRQENEGGLEAVLKRISRQAAEAVAGGSKLIILSDRNCSQNRPMVPVLLAAAAVHNSLIEESLRMSCSILIETAQAWSTHQFACLLSFGAEAICPYLALETIRQRVESKSGACPSSLQTAIENYLKAADSGMLKIMSKMGVSTLSSYIGAQIFECIGIGREVIDLCFPGIKSHLHALSFDEIEAEQLRFHRAAFAQEQAELQNRGFLRQRANGEYHANNPELVAALHKALGYRKSLTNSAEDQLNEFMKYASLTRKHEPCAVRDLLTFVSDREPIPLSEVETTDKIITRFCSGGMSLGALSPEAHTVLAIAMNRMGAKSNSGEGGEDPARYRVRIKVEADGSSADFPGLSGLREGDCAASAIRQVASARFGVTPEYLVTARQLEIKMAQGAKPGEGGQLPGAKVSDYIARLRCADAGTTLISPPTHHDIYSIEDLAQLIFDLKEVNPQAPISVKLVAEAGIGTIAAGVAKARADIIQVSGHDGGTGASPLSSIKHAGIPWELGLAEVQRVLLETGLRNRVLLRVDGGLRSAWDIVIAALLGAEEFGFGSIALVAQGCIMARVCHTNNCPVGITSQKEALRQKFPGMPEKVVEFFSFLAEDMRYMLAGLGYRSLADIIGRQDLLKRRPVVELPKSKGIDLSSILSSARCTPAPEQTSLAIGETANLPAEHSKQIEQSQADELEAKSAPQVELAPQANSAAQARLTAHVKSKAAEQISQQLIWNTHQLANRTEHGADSLNSIIIQDPDIVTAIKWNKDAEKSYSICNRDRATGAAIAGKIASIHTGRNFGGRIRLKFRGAAGQSFGAFLVDGIRLFLSGEANDYVGKGMNGGEIIVSPYEGASWAPEKNTIIGNACLYGATGGALFAAGQAGERFAVRNSRAIAVVEGTGDHCCEYMTGGWVAVLGKAGRNFGAGMTGGVAYVLDEDGSFPALCNIDETMELKRTGADESAELRRLLEHHYNLSGSHKAEEILRNWSDYSLLFWQLSRKNEFASALASLHNFSKKLAEEKTAGSPERLTKS